MRSANIFGNSDKYIFRSANIFCTFIYAGNLAKLADLGYNSDTQMWNSFFRTFLRSHNPQSWLEGWPSQRCQVRSICLESYIPTFPTYISVLNLSLRNSLPRSVWPYQSVMSIKEHVLDLTLRKADVGHSLSVWLSDYLSDCLSDCQFICNLSSPPPPCDDNVLS